VPLINIIILVILDLTHIMPLNFVAIGTIVIMMATPTAAVASAYAISYDREAVLASNASLLSTISAVVMMPIWIAILNILNQAGIFH
ncbi:AEC family transporter, partial [Oenococcus oeni]